MLDKPPRISTAFSISAKHIFQRRKRAGPSTDFGKGAPNGGWQVENNQLPEFEHQKPAKNDKKDKREVKQDDTIGGNIRPYVWIQEIDWQK